MDKRDDQLIKTLLKFKPGIQVQITRIAELLDQNRKIVAQKLEELQKTNQLPGEFHVLEQVFIRSSKQFIECLFCGFLITSYPCYNCKGGLNCGVCKLPLKKGNDILSCPSCDLTNHRKHLLEWLKTKAGCPRCKAALNWDGQTLSIRSPSTAQPPIAKKKTITKRKTESHLKKIIRNIQSSQKTPSYKVTIEKIEKELGFSLGNRITIKNGHVVGLRLNLKRLTVLPDSIADLEHLRDLDLSHNTLRDIPEFIVNLTNLKSCKLGWNRLEKFPECIGNLTNLEELDLNGNQLETLPSSLNNLANLKALNLRNNKLKKLPELINLSNLQKLDLSDNQLESLPVSIGNLPNLRELLLWKNNLEELPESLDKLNRLVTLDLSSNKLKRLPETFGRNRNIETLDLSSNNLEELPKSFGNLTLLKILDLSSNKLKDLPKSFEHLVNLNELYLSSNQLEHLPEPLVNLQNLNILEITNNSLRTVPAEAIKILVVNGTKIEGIACQSCGLQTLPCQNCKVRPICEVCILPLNDHENIFTCPQCGLQAHQWHFNSAEAKEICPKCKKVLKWKNKEKTTKISPTIKQSSSTHAIPHDFKIIKKIEMKLGSPLTKRVITNKSNVVGLDLQSLHIGWLLELICSLTGLQTLSLRNNKLKQVPECVGNLPNLQELDLSDNQLEILPKSICSLAGLQTLSLGNNKLKQVPECVGNLPNLQELDLSDNQLEILPKSICSLTGLQTLSLRNNKIKQLPECIGNLRNLQELDLSDNQLGMLPMSIVNVKSLQTINLAGNPKILKDVRRIFSRNETKKIVGELNLNRTKVILANYFKSE